MNHSRHHAREVALQILYHFDLQAQQNGQELAAEAPTGPALVSALQTHFEHFQVSSGVREFAAELVAGTLAGIREIDVEIERFAQNWKIPRMAVIDRNLLRMAYFELNRFPDTPPSVTIDEAVELGKQFGTADTPSFVNAILDNIRKSKAS